MDIDEGQEIVEQEAFEQEEKKSAVLSRSRTRSRSRSRLCNFFFPTLDIFMVMFKTLVVLFFWSIFFLVALLIFYRSPRKRRSRSRSGSRKRKHRKRSRSRSRERKRKSSRSYSSERRAREREKERQKKGLPPIRSKTLSGR